MDVRFASLSSVCLPRKNSGQAAALGRDLAVRIQIHQIVFRENQIHEMFKGLGYPHPMGEAVSGLLMDLVKAWAT